MVGVLEVCSIGSWEMVGSSRANQQRDDSRNGPSFHGGHHSCSGAGKSVLSGNGWVSTSSVVLP